MKVLFVIRSTGYYFYFQSIVEALFRRNHKIKVLFDKIASNRKLEEIKPMMTHGVLYGWAANNNSKIRKLFYYIRDFLGLRRYVKVSTQSSFYKDRWIKHRVPLIRLIVNISWLRSIFVSDLAAKIIKFIDQHFPIEPEIAEEIKKFAPDVVITSPANLGFTSADIEYLRVAKKLGLKTAVPVISWDNLTTKGTFYTIPDRLLVWNQTQAKEAFNHHGITGKNIRIIGAPLFDFWFSEQKPSLTKKEFCSHFKLNPKWPIIVYLGSSVDIAGDETWLVKNLRTALDQSSNQKLKQVQIIIRPHPHNSLIFRKFELDKVIVETSNFPENDKTRSLLFDTLHHSVAAVGVNTSAMIDTIILGKPVISVLIDHYSSTQSQAEHFKYLAKSGAASLVKSPTEFTKEVGKILDGKDTHKIQRREFVKKFIRPHGFTVSAGENAARRIEKLVQESSKS